LPRRAGEASRPQRRPTRKSRADIVGFPIASAHQPPPPGPALGHQGVEPIGEGGKGGDGLLGLRILGRQIGAELGRLLVDPRLGGGEPVSLDAKLRLKPLDVGLQRRVVRLDGGDRLPRLRRFLPCPRFSGGELRGEACLALGRSITNLDHPKTAYPVYSYRNN
jgi:hypothetical protein